MNQINLLGVMFTWQLWSKRIENDFTGCKDQFSMLICCQLKILHRPSQKNIGLQKKKNSMEIYNFASIAICV